jgi:hypothetical protein
MWFMLFVAGLSACQQIKSLGEPTYAEIRFVHDLTKIEMVTFIKAYGDADCQKAVEEYTKGYTEGAGEGWSRTATSCETELNELYQRIFNDEQIHATYMKISKSEGWQYEARAVFYGVPSSHAQEVCQQAAKRAKRRFKADVECVQGTVG